MKINIDIDDEIVAELAKRFNYQSMLPTEDGGGVPNPVSQESFIKMILVEQVVGLLIEDRLNQEVSIQRENIKALLEQAIRDKIVIGE